VSLKAKDGRAVMRVADNGPGLPPGFNAVTNSNLGLDLINSLVCTDLHGEIRFENQETKGAVVSLTFPVSPESRSENVPSTV